MKILRCLPMTAVLGIIFFLSSQPGDTIDLPDIPDIDKLLHALVYGVLALTTAHAVPRTWFAKYPFLSPLLIVLFCLLYGISDEFHQSFVPNRTPSLLDLAADTLGAVLAMVLLHYFADWKVRALKQ